MRRLLLGIISSFAIVSGCGRQSDTPLPYADNRHTEAERFDSVFTEMRAASLNETYSLIVLKDGKVVYEKYGTGQEADYLHTQWSVSKTFTATAIGFACQDGLLKTSDKVIKFFSREQLPDIISEDLANLSVEDLLTMRSGLKADYVLEIGADIMPDACTRLLASGFRNKPGEKFEYNSSNTYLLSAIVTKVTGKSCEEYLDEKLFKPLGIRNHAWETSSEGISMGGWGLHVTTGAIAKMGQFFLQKGKWEGKQLLDSKWFDEAMSAKADTSFESHWQANKGYGYQMWCCTDGAYRLDGIFGQFSIILPEQNAVIACNSHSPDSNGRLLDLIWKHIVPYL